MMRSFICCLIISIILIVNVFGGGTETETLAPALQETLVIQDQSVLLEDKIVDEICNLCERLVPSKEYPFCLQYDFRKIREELIPFIEHMKPILKRLRNTNSELEVCDSICYFLNSFFEKIIKVTHFELLLDVIQPTDTILSCLISPKKENDSQSFIEEKYIKLKITSFGGEFNSNLLSGLIEVTKNQKGIIIDLRNNCGGKVGNLKKILPYFFNQVIPLVYYISDKHEPFFGNILPWNKELSKQNLKELIETIQSYWNLKDSGWKSYFLEDKHPINQTNIAILINKNSMSCSEELTMVLKTHYPDRVKVIGTRSAGSLLTSTTVSLSSHLDLKLIYPFEEIIGIDGTRVEGIGIEPDLVSEDETEIMNAAIEWVTR